MTFEQIFSARMLLMRAQRHIAQAGVVRYVQGSYLTPLFRSPADEEAFFLVERNLVDLEREFDDKRKRCRKQKRRELADRADRQAEML